MKEKILIVEDEYIESGYLRAMLEKAGYAVCGIARSVDKALELIKREEPGLVLVDIFLTGKRTGIDLARQLKEQGIAFVYLSANSNESILTLAKTTEPYGFLVKPYRENDLLITLEIAQYRHKHSLESKYRREAVLQNKLERIAAENNPWEQKLLAFAKAMQPHIPFDFLMFNTRQNDIGFLRVGFEEYETISPAKAYADRLHMESSLTLSPDPKTESLTISFLSRRPDIYHTEHSTLFDRLRQALTKSMETILPIETTHPSAEGKPAGAGKFPEGKSPDGKSREGKSPVGTPSEGKSREGTHPEGNPSVGKPSDRKSPEGKFSEGKFSEGKSAEGEKPEAPGFQGIIGKSPALLAVFDTISNVAPSDTSVLILGESGTGKEMIASCIHQLSLRKDQPLVKVNCAAIPPTLIESELFGHEKGSFTGALEKRIGKFELAQGGTIFLDEIGEMPIELQTRLLHVLQDRAIERVGSKAPIRIDVRVIAATNRNLAKEVAEGRFRLDLYYRLYVIPITLPPLRERKDDILDLADYFIAVYNKKAGKRITGLSAKATRTMMAYHWPGNVRELEHMIERCVLLTKGSVIEDIPISLKKTGSDTTSHIKTIQENERDHIISVLKQCNGKIWGPGAAAEILNLPPTTLRSKMKRLGIEKDYQ